MQFTAGYPSQLEIRDVGAMLVLKHHDWGHGLEDDEEFNRTHRGLPRLDHRFHLLVRDAWS